MTPIKISRSDLSTFTRCRKRSQFEQRTGEKQSPTQPMTFGTLGHYGLAAGYDALQGIQRGVFKDLPDARLPKVTSEQVVNLFTETANDAIDSMVRQGYSIYRGEKQPLGMPQNEDEARKFVQGVKDSILYYATVQVPSDFTRYKILFTEREFSYVLPIGYDTPNGYKVFEVEFSGVLDLGAEDLTYANKRVLTIFDHKFKGLVSTAKQFLPIDTQMLFYEIIAWHVATEQMGYDDVELIYNCIRRDVPPGFGSRSTKTPSGQASKASTRVEDYLLREPLFHSTNERRVIESDFRDTVADYLTTNANDGPWPRTEIQTGGESCGQCQFLARCGANLIGQGVPKIGLAL